MALYHGGAFAGSLHGSTKNTTFRRSKSGIVAYDRVDPHTGVTRGPNDVLTEAQIAFYLTTQLLQRMGIIPYNATTASKRGSKYNEFFKLIRANIVAATFGSQTSDLYGKQYTRANVDEWIASNAVSGSGDNPYNGVISVMMLLYANLPFTKGNSVAQLTIAGTGTAQTVGVSCYDGKAHKVRVIAIDLVNAGNIAIVEDSIAAMGTKVVNVALTATAVVNQRSDWMGKKPVFFIVEIDGKPVSGTASAGLKVYE